MTLSIVVAADEGNVIGGGNTLLWNIPEDLKRFRALTKGHPVIMGRKTYESIMNFRGSPLPDRQNIIITRNKDFAAPDCTVVASFDAAIAAAKDTDEVFIIGGGEIYAQALPYTHKIYLTRVHDSFEGDTYFPELSADEWKEVSQEKHEGYTFFLYERVKQ